jgi:hypothetical protein
MPSVSTKQKTCWEEEEKRIKCRRTKQWQKNRKEIKSSLHLLHSLHVWVSGGIAPLFTTWAVNSGKLSTSYYSRFNPKESIRGTQWIGGWVRPTANVDIVE